MLYGPGKHGQMELYNLLRRRSFCIIFVQRNIRIYQCVYKVIIRFLHLFLSRCILRQNIEIKKEILNEYDS